MIELSARVRTMTSSPTLKLVQIKKQLQAQGKVILDFGAGEPDFPTPENIKNAGVAAIQNNFTKYTPTAGIAELKKAIQASYQAEQGYGAKDNQIVVSPGSKYGLFLLLQAVIDPGDEVIVPLPYWVSYPEMVKFCGGRRGLCRPPAAGPAVRTDRRLLYFQVQRQDQGRHRQFPFQSDREGHERRGAGGTDRFFP